MTDAYSHDVVVRDNGDNDNKRPRLFCLACSTYGRLEAGLATKSAPNGAGLSCGRCTAVKQPVVRRDRRYSVFVPDATMAQLLQLHP